MRKRGTTGDSAANVESNVRLFFAHSSASDPAREELHPLREPRHVFDVEVLFARGDFVDRGFEVFEHTEHVFEYSEYMRQTKGKSWIRPRKYRSRLVVGERNVSVARAPIASALMAESLVSLFELVWDDIVALCDGLTDEEWDLATECPGWSVKDNVAHMIGTERMLLGESPEADPVEGAPHVRNDIGKANEQWIASYRARAGKEVLDEFRAVTARRLEALRALTDDDWNREGFTPEGPGPYSLFMAIRVFDCWYHDQDIREALGRPGFLDGPVADLTLGRIPPKGLPYVVGKKAGVPPGSTVVFEVAGSPPIVAAVSVPPEGRAALLDTVPAEATVALTMDRRTFARLAGGRWSGDRAREIGRLRIEGDRALGDRIVDNMAFTI
jgi:uncharacterized protein (TIGR03083 family)